MKKLFAMLSFLLLVAAFLTAYGQTRATTYSGEIMDSQCAAMGNHDAGYKMTDTKTAKECTIACVKMGGQYVLYDAAKKILYKLDDQKKPEPFAGEKVKITGTYDAGTKTIHVDKIAAAK